MRWFALLLAVLGCFSAVQPARAEAERRFALHWARSPGAEGCIEPRALARRVEQLTGPAFVAPGEAAVTLEASVAPYQRGFRVHVFRVGADGGHAAERVLTGPLADCRKLDAVVAFVLALTIDPALSLSGLPPELLSMFAEETPPEEQLLSELESQPEVAATVEAPVVVAPPPPAKVAPLPEPPSARTRYAVSLSAAVLGVTLPPVLFGVQAALELDLPRLFPLVLSARGFARSREDVVGGGAFASFRAADGAVAVCPLGVQSGRLRVRGCVGFSLGRLSARGVGFDMNRDASIWDAALLSTLSLGLRLARGFSLVLEAQGRLRVLGSGFEFVSESGQRESSVDPSLFGVVGALGALYEF